MKKLLFAFYGIFGSLILKAQAVSINTDGTRADTSAILDLKSTSKGFLMPRLTKAQKNLILQPATGLLIFQTDEKSGFYFYNGLRWLLLPMVQDNTLIYTTKGF